MQASQLILVISGESEIHVGHLCRPFFSRALVEKTSQGWNLLLRKDLAMLHRRPFTICGNPNKVNSTDNSA